MNNIAILEDTLNIISRGWYMKDGKKINLKLSPRDMTEAKVFLPSDVHALGRRKTTRHYYSLDKPKCGYGCENIDSFTKARNNYVNYRYLFNENDKEILVLNFANPVNPGAAFAGARGRRRRTYAEQAPFSARWKAVKRPNITNITEN